MDISNIKEGDYFLTPSGYICPVINVKPSGGITLIKFYCEGTKEKPFHTNGATDWAGESQKHWEILKIFKTLPKVQFLFPEGTKVRLVGGESLIIKRVLEISNLGKFEVFFTNDSSVTYFPNGKVYLTKTNNSDICKSLDSTPRSPTWIESDNVNTAGEDHYYP